MGWVGPAGLALAITLDVLAIALGIVSINTDDDRLSHWVSFPAVLGLAITILLYWAMERKRQL